MAHLRNLVWIYHTRSMTEEYQGWRHPLWRGSDDWPGDDTGRYWRRTVVIRIPAHRYLIVAVPFRRRHHLSPAEHTES